MPLIYRVAANLASPTAALHAGELVAYEIPSSTHDGPR